MSDATTPTPSEARQVAEWLVRNCGVGIALTVEQREKLLELERALRQGGEAVEVEAVARIERDRDGDKRLEWLIEGDIADLPIGAVLCFVNADIPDDGHLTLYTPPAQEHPND